MTNEQWLVYLWSIYPEGLFIQIWVMLLIIFIIGMIPVAINHFDGCEDETTMWSKLGKWGWVYNVTREVPYLRKVIRVEDDYKNRFNDYKFTKAVIVSRGDTSGEVGYRFCEPFLGELPSLINNKG